MIQVLTSAWFIPQCALFMLQVSPEDEDVVSADEDTVTMEVNDSEEGREALSEKAESVSALSHIPSPPAVCWWCCWCW